MKHIRILIIVFVVICTSCDKKNEPLQKETISGSILNHKEKVLTLYDFLGKSQWEQQIEVKDGVFKINLEINQPTIKSFAYGNNLPKDIFLLPNKTASVSFDANDFENSFRLKGDLEVENSILDSISSKLLNLDYKYVYTESLENSIIYLDSLELNSKEILRNLLSNNKTVANFENFATACIEYNTAYLKLDIAGRKDQHPKDYYDFLNNLSFTEPYLLEVFYYRMFLQSYIEKETKSRIQKLDSLQKQDSDFKFKESLKVIAQLEHDEIRAYSLYNAMMLSLMDSGVNEFEKYYDYFKRNNKDQHYEEQLQLAISEKKKIEPGKLAPEIAITDINGKEFLLSNFQGKYVYLDFWATTCPYCIKETDSYVQLYSDYGTNEIEFVSISADLDENRWKNYVEEHKNVGSILRVENSWDSKAFQSYQINSSPTYVLIDREGKIIDPVAPRPSSKEIRETFDKLLSTK
tara:strand:+ start:86 stop:1477 length:1392 start_codon:yes stop_codon:yes gene_type:complete